MFHGKPPRIKLLKKSTVENKILIRIIEDIFNSIHQNINELLNSIIDSFNDDKSLKFQPFKINSSDILDQINKYNEINDIIKTLEVMN